MMHDLEKTQKAKELLGGPLLVSGEVFEVFVIFLEPPGAL
jgi:hypothetical protein